MVIRSLTETINIAPRTTTTGALGSKIASYGAKVAHAAHVQPLSSSHVRAEYGARADRMRQLFLDTSTAKEGDGVWLAGESANDPPWIVISVAEWGKHTELRIERRDAVG